MEERIPHLWWHDNGVPLLFSRDSLLITMDVDQRLINRTLRHVISRWDVRGNKTTAATILLTPTSVVFQRSWTILPSPKLVEIIPTTNLPLSRSSVQRLLFNASLVVCRRDHERLRTRHNLVSPAQLRACRKSSTFGDLTETSNMLDLNSGRFNIHRYSAKHINCDHHISQLNTSEVLSVAKTSK